MDIAKHYKWKLYNQHKMYKKRNKKSELAGVNSSYINMV